MSESIDPIASMPHSLKHHEMSANNSAYLNELFDIFRSILAGGFAGTASLIVGHPFDTIKVRLQTIPYIHAGNGQRVIKNNTIDCAKLTLKYEGFFGLYKGFLPILFGVIPSYSTYFLGYSLGLKLQGTQNTDYKYHQVFLAGAFGGAFGDLVSIPSERLKCLLQVQTILDTRDALKSTNTIVRYNGMIDCARHLYKNGGLQSLYKGTLITLLRDIPTGGIYITCYTYLKNLLNKNSSEFSFLSTLVAGGCAGVSSSLIGLPFDTIKSRFQTAPDGRYANARAVFVDLIKTDGIYGLYRGLPPVLIRTFPANAACFLGFEFIQSLLS